MTQTEKPTLFLRGVNRLGQQRSTKIKAESGEWLSSSQWNDAIRSLTGDSIEPVYPYAVKVAYPIRCYVNEKQNQVHKLRAFSPTVDDDPDRRAPGALLRCRANRAPSGTINMQYQITWR